jgi:hypothetical protein
MNGRARGGGLWRLWEGEGSASILKKAKPAAKQKTFANRGLCRACASARRSKSFLVLFFKKEHSLLSLLEARVVAVTAEPATLKESRGCQQSLA